MIAATWWVSVRLKYRGCATSCDWLYATHESAHVYLLTRAHARSTRRRSRINGKKYAFVSTSQKLLINRVPRFRCRGERWRRRNVPFRSRICAEDFQPRSLVFLLVGGETLLRVDVKILAAFFNGGIELWSCVAYMFALYNCRKKIELKMI